VRVAVTRPSLRWETSPRVNGEIGPGAAPVCYSGIEMQVSCLREDAEKQSYPNRTPQGIRSSNLRVRLP
jgi:hypothetical protein